MAKSALFPLTQKKPIQTECTSLSMRTFEQRLNTFVGWPSKIVTALALANNGFYYTNINDTVKCAFCHMQLNCWAEGDIPEKIHEELSPRCIFVLESKKAFDVCGKFKQFEETKPSMYPKFKKLEKRLETFEDWPISLAQRPEILARAGFFYSGKGDRTLCFSCGLGLKDWEKDDEPWEEHAKWSSNCEYLIICKGEDYVINVCEKFKIAHNLKASKEIAVNKNVNEPEKEEKTDKQCLMCCNEDIQVVFLPCGHACACRVCGYGQEKCPMCRNPIQSINNLYLP